MSHSVITVRRWIIKKLTGHWWSSPHKGQWRGALMFSLICAWINNREAGDLRRHLAHSDVILLKIRITSYDSYGISLTSAIMDLAWWLVMAYFVQGHLRPSPSVTGPLFAKRTALLSQDPWWRHQMETFSALLAICAGNSPGTGEFPAQRSVTRSFDVFFDMCPNKPLSKQWWGWWFETLSRPFWRHCNALEVSKPRDWML